VGWGVLEVLPLSEWYFRVPSPLEPGVHGPGVSRGSLTYPLPSTIAGALAFMAYRKGLCSASENVDVEFNDLRECISGLFGKQAVIRPGFSARGDSYYAYIGSPVMPRLDRLREKLQELAFRIGRSKSPGLTAHSLIGRLIREGDPLMPLHGHRTGIAIARSSKNVIEGHLYSVEYVDYRSLGAKLVALVKPKPGKPIKDTTRFGGEGGVALASLREPEKEEEMLVQGRGDTWAFTLLTPALLDSAPTAPLNPSSPKLGEELGSLITSMHSCVEEAKVLHIPRGELDTSTILPGWRLNKPRKPHLLIPPGTAGLLVASPNCARDVAEKGVGAHSDIGWGTILLVSSHKA